METAWSEGRTVWPLTELPLDDRLQGFVSALAAPDAEKRLASVYDRQFAGQSRELRAAAATLGLFGVQYVRGEGDYSDDERAHYAQLLTALSQWGQQAPLGDAGRARKSIPQLVSAARLTGLAGDQAFRRAGMERSLHRLGPFFARFKRVLEGYGLDLDEALDGVQVVVEEQTGDRARVRLNYTIAGQAIEAARRRRAPRRALVPERHPAPCRSGSGSTNGHRIALIAGCRDGRVGSRRPDLSI